MTARDRVRRDAAAGALMAPVHLNADETRAMREALRRRDYARANEIAEAARARQTHADGRITVGGAPLGVLHEVYVRTARPNPSPAKPEARTDNPRPTFAERLRDAWRTTAKESK